MKKLIQFGVIFLLVLIASTGMAQSSSDDHPVKDVVLKVSGINPAVGVTFSIDTDTDLRLLGFFSTNLNWDSFGSNHHYFLDISYLKYNDWINSESLQTYWGIDLSVIFEDPVIAPGGLVGASYKLSDRFSIFGEAGLNVFIVSEFDAAYLAMFNTGLGLKVAL